MAWKKLVLQKIMLRDMLRNRIPRVCFYFFPRNGIPRIFLLCGTVWNGIPRVFVPRNGSDLNSESLLLFLFHGTEFRAFFSSVERFGTEFREFSVPRNSRNSAGTNQLFRLFRLPRTNFLSEIANPGADTHVLNLTLDTHRVSLHSTVYTC
jgi:hypothetical protein